MKYTRAYLLVILTVILTLNYVDRFALGMLMEDIKRDLSLSDTQLGFLTGIAFALFYATMGIPIAHWADRGNRVTIISLTMALWSAAVALCATAVNFVQLLLLRMSVAVGEAGCYPPALSLISDYYDRGERPRAVSRYMLGVPLALVIGIFAAGWLNQYFGWRVTFLVLGMPGLIFAILSALTLQEPRRGTSSADNDESVIKDAASAANLRFKDVVQALWVNRAFRHIFFCFSVWGFFGYGIQQWLPTFFMRSHHINGGELGTWLAISNGVGGLLGTWLGGELASRYARNNERLQLLAIAVTYAMLAVLWVVTYLAPSQHVAFAVMGLSGIGAWASNGPLFAATQTLVPARMRAMSISLMYFCCNLIGLGLGPLAVGVLADALRPRFGDESLRYALLAMSPGFLWCSWHLWLASKTVDRDIGAITFSTEVAH